jgi:hypothetical protein
VIPGFQAFSSSSIERQTVPEGNTFGWNNGGVNLPKEHVGCGKHNSESKLTFRGLGWIFCNIFVRLRETGRIEQCAPSGKLISIL